MTSLTGEFQTDLPLDGAHRACTEAINGLGWHIEAVEPDRIVSHPDTGTPYPPKIEVVLTESGQATDVRIIGSDDDGDPLEQGQLIAELDRVRDAIKASVRDPAGEPQQGPPAGWYPDPSDSGQQRYWDGRGWTRRVEPDPAELQAPPSPGARRGESRRDGSPVTTGPERAGRARSRVALFLAAVVLLAAGVGVGGYFLGRSTGKDLGAARAAGAAAGQKRGAAKGAAEGYAAGLKAGRKAGYSQSYASAYKSAYRNAFERAGLSAPTKVSVPK